MPLQLAAREQQHFLNGVVDVELRHLRPGFLSESPKTADHAAGALGVPHHARERNPRFVEVGLVPVQPVQTSFGIGHDRAERLVYLMRE